MNTITIVGLTGQTGSGKTTICGVFEQCGFIVINADLVAREVTQKGSPCLKELVEVFGEKILTDDGQLNRKLLGGIVFGNKTLLEQLNSISYPYITAEILSRIEGFKKSGKKLILLDAPTLFESRTDDFCELIISVIAKPEIRLARIMERDGLSEEDARNRIKSQQEEQFFIQNSDFIIKNNKGMDNLQSVAKEVAEKIRNLYL